MKIELVFAELHTPLFFHGVNHGLKLDVTRRPMKLIYDRSEKELIMFFNKKTAIIPTNNVASMTPKDADALGYFEHTEKKKEAVPAPKGKIKAQVSHPVEDLVYGEPK